MARARGKSGSNPSGDGTDPRIRDLFAVAPAEFTRARDALARDLASEGSADAARVKRLRRPTLSIWILNALARERPDDLGALLQAGDRLRQTQVRALRGETAELRNATDTFQDALREVLSEAPRVGAAGLGREPAASVLGEVERALRAAATADAEAREALESGVLDRLPEPGGLELLTGLAAVAPAAATGGAVSSRPAPGGRTAPRDGRREEAAGRSREPDRRAAERERRAAERQARADAARRERERRRAAAEVERLDRALRAAETRVREAERELERAKERVAVARNQADRAREAARAARAKAGLAAPA